MPTCPGTPDLGRRVAVPWLPKPCSTSCGEVMQKYHVANIWHVAMSARDGDAFLERVRAAHFQWNCEPEDLKEATDQFQKLVALVKAVYNNRLPFDLENAHDPGALFEYDEYLQQLQSKDGKLLKEGIRTKVLSQDDPRAVRSQEVLREAFFYAYKQRWGFEAIGRPPELQQLIAATSLDIYTSFACTNQETVSSSARLLRQLCPQLQVNLLADVATGILCPRWVLAVMQVAFLQSHVRLPFS